LWQGGKGNENKIHLVNWETVKKSKADGGLQIRDPVLVNLTFGGKILWTLVNEHAHPVSLTLREKYGVKKTLSNLQKDSSTNCTQIWKLCCKSNSFFKNSAYRIPGNGKRTLLWQDSIMGKAPLAENEDIAKLRDWLERVGINNLYDLSKWDQQGEWTGWDFHRISTHLALQQSVLEYLLEDAAPINRSMKYRWGWGKTGYTPQQKDTVYCRLQKLAVKHRLSGKMYGIL
jgi:hypothetical protein